MTEVDKTDKENQEKDFKAKKSLGQNFLHAPHIIAMMVHTARIVRDDLVLEIGPGKGVLTEGLLASGARVIAVEKDDRAIPFLREKFKDEIEAGKLKLIHGDILELDLLTIGLSRGHYTIVANLPYYISGEFLRKFLESEIQPTRIVIMLQKELAKRIVDDKQSILSVAVRVYSQPKYITSVPKKFFRPMPKVDSAVICLENISKKFFLDGQIEEKSFFDRVRSGFSHKRKVLIRNLESQLTPKTLKKLWEEEKWSTKVRAEELSLEDWQKIAKVREE